MVLFDFAIPVWIYFAKTLNLHSTNEEEAYLWRSWDIASAYDFGTSGPYLSKCVALDDIERPASSEGITSYDSIATSSLDNLAQSLG